MLLDPVVLEIDAPCRYPLKAGLREDVDFMFVPDSLWNMWAKVYGGLSLSRSAYYGKDSLKPVIDIYLYKISLFIRPFTDWTPSEEKALYASRKDTIISLRDSIKQLCTELRSKISVVRAEIHFRLWKVERREVQRLGSVKYGEVNAGMSVRLEGVVVDEKMLVEELRGDFVLLAELGAAGNVFGFKEVRENHVDARSNEAPSLRIPSYPNKTSPRPSEKSWKELATLEGNKFMEIPLNSIVDLSSTKCGAVGLQNLGNTCYMNSGLQCLSNCQELTKYFLLNLYSREINVNNPLGQQGRLAKEYASLIHTLWETNSRSANPAALKSKVEKTASQFKGYEQHDSQEFISYMLDGLHEDLNRIKKKPYMEIDTDTKISDEELSAKMWDYHLARNNSVITDLFCGQQRSRLICPKCSKESVTFDPFMSLSLGIPQLERLTVIYAPSKLAKRKVAVEMVVNFRTHIREIRQRLMKHLNFDEEKEFLFATIENGCIKNKFVLNSICGLALSAKALYAFEVAPQCSALEVRCQYVVKKTFSSAVQDFAHPLALSVPAECTVGNVKKEVVNLFNEVIKGKQLKHGKTFS